MIYQNILDIHSRQDFREWLKQNFNTQKECYVHVKRGKPTNNNVLWYLDAVEEALCFGWIDSTVRIIDGKRMQRFSPRNKKSNWTELNKERVRRLEKLGLMTDAGRKILPTTGIRNFTFDKEIETELKKARVWTKFRRFHPLYQKVRASNLAFHKKRHPESYKRMLNHIIEETKNEKMYGEWNDYGRLLEY